MKKNKLHIIVLCFCVTLNIINNEAFANVNKEVGNNSFSIDSLKKNVEVDLRLSYAFFIHHHFEMCDWGEYKIVIIFSIVGLLSGILGSVIAVMNDVSHIVI